MTEHECIRPEALAELPQWAPDDPRRLEAEACPQCRILIRSYLEFEAAVPAPGSRPAEARAQLEAQLAEWAENAPETQSSDPAREVRTARERPRKRVWIAAAMLIFLIPSLYLLNRTDPASPFLSPTPDAQEFVLRPTPDAVLRSNDPLPVRILTIYPSATAVAIVLRAPREAEPGQSWALELLDADERQWTVHDAELERAGEVYIWRLWIDPARLLRGETRITATRADPSAAQAVYYFHFGSP